MKRSDLIWAICDIDEDLLTDTPKKLHRLRSLRAVLIAAAVVLLLCGTAFAAFSVVGWDQIFSKALSIPEDSTLSAEESRSDIYVTATENGYTYTVKQVLGSDHDILVALDITLPQEVSVPELSMSELRAEAEENGCDWSEVEYWIRSYQNSGTNETILYPIRLSEASIWPVSVDKETLFQGGTSGDSSDVHRTLYHAALDAFGGDTMTGEGTSFGHGMLYHSYDPETRTLSVMLFVHSDNELPGSDCTLVLQALELVDLEAAYANPDAEIVSENLIQEPVVLHFSADYTAQSLGYTIYQEDQEIGTMTLSPFSAFLSFPQEPDDPDRIAPNWTDYLKGRDYETITVTLSDGTDVALKMKSSGITTTQDAYYYAERLFSLEDVTEVKLGDYTIVPQT
jgi:hypothetical protein